VDNREKKDNREKADNQEKADNREILIVPKTLG
jgi:hypothetical protein